MAFNIELAEVIWKWQDSFRGLGSKAEQFIRYFIEDIRDSRLPDTKVELTQLKVGMIFGGKRDYLEISANHLGDYRIFIGARAYGAHLSLSFFLVSKPGIWGKRTSPLNTFELQDLGDYLTSTQISLISTLHRLAKEAGMDPKDMRLTFKELTTK